MANPPPKRSATGISMRSHIADSHAIVSRLVAATSPPIPKEVNNWRIYFYAVSLCMGAAAYGYDTGFFGGTIALQSFMRDFGFEGKSPSQRDSVSANLVSLFQGGSFFGAAMQLPATQILGRKWTVVISNLIFIASAFVQWFSNGSEAIMMGGRFMGGFAIGISSLVIPVYLAEVAPPNIRGRLVGFYDIFIQVGTLLGFWINYVLARSMESTKLQWQIPVFLQLVPAALLAAGIFFVPETPRWLLSKGRDEQASRNLSKMRNLPEDHEYLQWELDQTRAQLAAEELVRGDAGPMQLVKDLFGTPGHRYRLFIGIALIFFKTFSGVQAVNYYSPRIFRQLGFSGSTQSLLATGLYGTVKGVCTFIFGFFIVDRVGRRRPLLFGSTVGAGCLFYMGAYLTARGSTTGRQPGDYSAIVAIFLYAAIYCFGYNSVPLTIISEIFTLRLRTLSMTFCLMWQWLITFCIVRLMPVLLTNITTKTYFVFGSIFVMAGPFVYFFVPETKGLPLEAMDQLFGRVERTDVERAILEAEERREAALADEEKGGIYHAEHADGNRTTYGHPTASALGAQVRMGDSTTATGRV